MGDPVLYSNRQRIKPAVAVPMYYGWIVVVMAIWLIIGIEPAEVTRLLAGLMAPLVLVTGYFLGFRSLMVTVTRSHVELVYSLGWPRKRIERGAIVSSEYFRIPWWYGLGIRSAPKGWMWNVWGRDTVLLTRTDGKRFLIGTDDHEGLLAALASSS